MANDLDPSPRSGPDVLALAAAGITAAGHFVSTALGWPGPFVVGACAFWLVFLGDRVRRDRRWLAAWGLRKRGLLAATRFPLGLTAVALASFALYAASRGALHFPPHALFCLVLYPLWGLIQQVLILGVVVGNLEPLECFRRRRVLLVLVGALVFGAVHLPALLLTVGTTLLALLYVPHFLRHRNVWPLGVAHGWIGTGFYLWVLGRDPWLELFGIS
ncbi:MAG: hypothetical protein JNM84_01420 [Planctomycetes bacterium]|nr:hypothetical protein [Planctomycetota bacterium]